MAEEMVMDRAARNAELLRSGYEAFGRGDLAQVEAIFAPDVTWHAYRLGQLGGDHDGWGAVAEFFGRTMQLTAGTFRLEVLDVIPHDRGKTRFIVREGAAPVPPQSTATSRTAPLSTS